jgi:hypothetical protein
MRDKNMLQTTLDRESAIERLEAEEKRIRRQEVVDLQKHYMQKAQDKRAEELLIEELTRLESEKQWKMREDKWRKEDQARINLLRNVYDSRAHHIELKKKLKEEDQWMVSNEKAAIDAEIERQNREYEEKRAREQLYRQKHQGDILMQINDRDRQQRRDLQEKMYEERAAKLAEINYVRKIETQKQENTQTLSTLRGNLLS